MRLSLPCPVAPYTGAWIEIERDVNLTQIGIVAPYTGAWIEIRFGAENDTSYPVAPYTGAWIEIILAV